MTEHTQTFTDNRFGFPIQLVNAPVRTIRGVDVLLVNATSFKWLVFAALIQKPAQLAGSEIRAIRLFLGMNASQFADALRMTHAAVLKWERALDESPNVIPATEFLMRLMVYEQLPPHWRRRVSASITKLRQNLLPMKKKGRAGISIDHEMLAAAA